MGVVELFEQMCFSICFFKMMSDTYMWVLFSVGCYVPFSASSSVILFFAFCLSDVASAFLCFLRMNDLMRYMI